MTLLFPARSPRSRRAVLARLLAVLLLTLSCTSCLSGLWAYGREVQDTQRPPLVLGARLTPEGALVVEFDEFEDWRRRPAVLVVQPAELDALLSGLPVESRYRLALPHGLLRRTRFPEDPPPDLGQAGTAVPVLPWKTWGADQPANAAPEASEAPFAIAWAQRYRTGSERYHEALYVQRDSPDGPRRGVFLIEPYSARSWDLAARVVLVTADVLLIAALF